MRRQLAIVKGDIWAFRESGKPLVPATIMNQPAYYEASITIRIHNSPERGLISVKRVRLPCKWDRVEEYLSEHPEIPREYTAPPERGPSDHEIDPIGASAVDPLSIGAATIRRIVREEIQRVVGVPRISLNYKDAAYATGYSVGALRIAVRRGDLIPVYANSKPVFKVSELEAWVESLPYAWP